MIKRHSKKIIVSTAFVMALLSACDKDLSGYGNYSLGINNYSPKDYKLEAYLDGKFVGTFMVKALTEATYSNDCDDLKNGVDLQNTFLLPNISAGKHRLEFRDHETSPKCTVDVVVKSDACVTQSIVFN